MAAGPDELSAQARLGELIFHDTTLSASGGQACASCHVAAFGHAAANALPAQLGGPALDRQGGRNAPSIRYLADNREFRFATDGTPTGGFFWDGRARSPQEQAGGPFLNPVEMANASRAEVVVRLSRAGYADEFRRVFGADILGRPDDAFDRITLALQAYELEDRDFRPYSSKYDEFLRGKVALGAAELRGLALFNSPAKGNCAACHPSAQGSDGSLPLFTDFSYDNLGLPRNPELAQNADPATFDLGLCARPGGDLAARTDLCGAFKVPSLRNVALRQALFHNGVFKNLKDALTFYVQRDTAPEKFYPRAGDGTLLKFNDLPPAYRGNVNTTEAPYNRRPGDAPALDEAEIDDLIAFLGTLTDGYAR
jgi:cytochrome c peroxidase